jgi:hypothetical protein
VANSNHNVRCEQAKGRVCECTGCGGSQHGWHGWLGHTGADHEERQEQRRRYENDLKWTGEDSPRLAPSNQNRQVMTDLARLDITDWLAIPSESHRTDLVEPYPSPVEQVTILAEELTRGTWQEIATDLGHGTSDVVEVKQELANHGWCDLFVALIQAIESTQRAFSSIPRKAKAIILAGPTQANRPHVSEAVVNIVVDKVWHAFVAAAFGGIPLLDILSNDDALRALRILAVFICPAPEGHEAVRRHALQPLGQDAARILTDQTKTRLAVLFAEWRADGGT